MHVEPSPKHWHWENSLGPVLLDKTFAQDSTYFSWYQCFLFHYKVLQAFNSQSKILSTKERIRVSEERLELSTNGLKGRASAHVSHIQCPAILTESVGQPGSKVHWNS
jgi:hypothetical protein